VEKECETAKESDNDKIKEIRERRERMDMVNNAINCLIKY